MLMQPRLATLTYAAPYLIASQAVAYQVNAISPSQAAASAQATTGSSTLTRASAIGMIATWPETLLPPATQERKNADFLVYKDDRWTSTPSLTADLLDAEISDSKL